MPRPPRKPIAAPTAPFWTTTYGDMMSLVLVFFVFLAAFSSLDITQFRTVQSSMKQGGQGVLKPEAGGAVVEMPRLPESREFQEAMEDLGEEMVRANLHQQVRVFWDKRGVRFVLQDAILFPPARAELSPAFLGILDKVLAVVRTLPVAEIQVEGHTDDTPIRTAQFPSNWELSSARAVSVLHYLERKAVVAPRQLVANGYGEFRPLVPNTSVGNRAQNRRVEIFVLKKP